MRELLAPQCCKKRAKKAESSEMVTERSHTLKGRAWMAEGFPLTAEQLIPILDILIPSNRHLQAMKRWVTQGILSTYGCMWFFSVSEATYTVAGEGAFIMIMMQLMQSFGPILSSL